MTVPVGTPAYPDGGSCHASTEKWENLPKGEQMRDAISDPLAAIQLFSLLMVKRDSKLERRDLHDKIVVELTRLQGLFNSHCGRPRKSLCWWLREHVFYR